MTAGRRGWRIVVNILAVIGVRHPARSRGRGVVGYKLISDKGDQDRTAASESLLCQARQRPGDPRDVIRYEPLGIQRGRRQGLADHLHVHQ